MKYILVTGCAGFIGFHLVDKLLKNKGIVVIGIDNINNYYDVNIKKQRLRILKNYNNFYFFKYSINNYRNLEKIFTGNKIHTVVNLAAQAGVRYSIENPDIYNDSNVKGFYNILRLSQIYKIKHLIFASSSSVYGDVNKFPTQEVYNTNDPESFYAATKKINETMARSFSCIYKLKCTGLRFFTVYGPYGRPDMSIYKFTKLISENQVINLNNDGNHFRDFTYIDDVIFFLNKIIFSNKINNKLFSIFNLCGSDSQKLTKVVKLIEYNLNKKAKINFSSFQIGDVLKTHGDNKKILKFSKKYKFIKIEEGIKKFILWYKNKNEISKN